MEYILEKGDRSLFRVEHIAGTMILRAKPGLTVGKVYKVWLQPKFLRKPRKTNSKEKTNKTKERSTYKERAKKATRVVGMREALRFFLHLQIEVV